MKEKGENKCERSEKGVITRGNAEVYKAKRKQMWRGRCGKDEVERNKKNLCMKYSVCVSVDKSIHAHTR